MEKHDTVKIILDASYTYSDFMGWYNTLSETEKEVWLHLAKSGERAEHNTILLTKKAMELYCLEMAIDYIPNSEEYLEKMFKKLTNNLIMVSLLDRGLINLKSGEISMLSEPEFTITERGKKFMSKKN